MRTVVGDSSPQTCHTTDHLHGILGTYVDDTIATDLYSDGWGTSQNRADNVRVYSARPGRRDTTCETPLIRMDFTVSLYQTIVL